MPKKTSKTPYAVIVSCDATFPGNAKAGPPAAGVVIVTAPPQKYSVATHTRTLSASSALEAELLALLYAATLCPPKLKTLLESDSQTAVALLQDPESASASQQAPVKAILAALSNKNVTVCWKKGHRPEENPLNDYADSLAKTCSQLARLAKGSLQQIAQPRMSGLRAVEKTASRKSAEQSRRSVKTSLQRLANTHSLL